MLHRGEPAERLSGRVLHPALQQRLIRFIESTLEIQQTDHQPGGPGRGSKVQTEAIRQSNVKSLPVDLLRENQQRLNDWFRNKSETLRGNRTILFFDGFLLKNL